MNTEELKNQYEEMVARIDAARMFDGRNSGVDVYVCDKCGELFHTRYKDKGTTPFSIKCRKCGKGTAVHKDTVSEMIASSVGLKVHNWVRPTFEQLVKLNEAQVKHVLDGGLVLEDELPGCSEDVKQKLDAVHDILEKLQDSKASFMFLSDNGGHFVVSGEIEILEAEILFSMIRYPIVRDIIETCAKRFPDVLALYGDRIKDVTLDRLIEKYQ